MNLISAMPVCTIAQYYNDDLWLQSEVFEKTGYITFITEAPEKNEYFLMPTLNVGNTIDIFRPSVYFSAYQFKTKHFFDLYQRLKAKLEARGEEEDPYYIESFDEIHLFCKRFALKVSTINE